MKCPRCGADVIVNEKMKFCTYCGLQITEEMLSGQNQDSTNNPENVNQGESSQEAPIPSSQEPQSFNGGQGSDQSNSVPLDNNTAPASNGNPGNNFVGSGAPNNNGLPPKQDNFIVSIWKKLSFFSKAFAIAITVSGILFIISVALHKGFPILFSCILIFGLIVALFMHKQIFFKQPHNVYKYLIVSGAFALIVITIWSFTWNNSSKNNETQVTEPVVENSTIKIPASSDSYIGKMYTDVSSEMSGLGFITVRTEEVKDLEISDKSKDKTVISVTSDSKSFSAGDEMPKNSVITIKYHGLADIAVPISSEEAKSMDYEAVAELFKKAGFTNVSTTTLQDKDPDEMTGEFETTITVGTNTNVEKSLKVPVDTKIEVCKHTAYEKFPVNLHFENNTPVGVIIKLNSKDESTVGATSASDIAYRSKKGTLNISMTVDDNKQSVEEKIEIDGPVNIGFVFEKEDSGYFYYKSYEEHNRELNAGEIRLSLGVDDCAGDYNNIVEVFKQLGFKNITASPVYDQDNSDQNNIISSVKIGDKSEFYRGEIYKDNSPIKIVYHMSKKSDPNYVPPQVETKPGQEAPKTITIENNPEFASLMTGHNGPGKDFFKNHVGDIIEFDGNVADVLRLGDSYYSGSNYLIFPGDYSEDSTVSNVMLQFRDVSKAQLNLASSMKGLYIGDNIHIIAKIKSFDEMNELVQLQSVAISRRYRNTQ